MRNSIVFLLVFFCSMLQAQTSFTKEVEHSVKQQLETYPQATLQDVYKNFFQDMFGPGHLISDSVRAAAYLREELASRDYFGGVDYELTGFRGNYYRVNLSVVKEGLVDFDTFLMNFLNSAKSLTPQILEEWPSVWQNIEQIIGGLNLSINNYTTDSLKLQRLMTENHYVVHHSNIFNATYDLHYRLIEKTLFETNILPLLVSKRSSTCLKGINNK